MVNIFILMLFFFHKIQAMDIKINRNSKPFVNILNCFPPKKNILKKKSEIAHVHAVRQLF